MKIILISPTFRRTGLNVRFSQFLNDDAMFNANFIGFSISLVYISLYYYFAAPHEKSGVLSNIFATAIFLGLALLYSKVDKTFLSFER